MKKGIMLNCEISAVIAKMGHTDTIVIADCGLPIPDTTKRIDISLTQGIPDFMTTLKAVLAELQVEEAYIAEEMQKISPKLLNAIENAIGNIPLKFIPHEELKHMSKASKACIRTGECTPYANIILKSGVTF